MESGEGHIFLVNKPVKWTSFDVVGKLRNRLKIKKIGHAGTLDPLASGLLIICAGKATRRIEEFMGLEKEYTGVFRLGATTPSHDLETEITITGDPTNITLQQIREALKAFSGTFQQLPPMHSAIRVGGRRAYQFARKGKEIALMPREVFVRQFEITRFSTPDVHFRVVCSKGTYIRSLARDLGEALGTGAYLQELCRTRIGKYALTDALEIPEVKLPELPPAS